jgi:hypothetical protein
MSIETTSQPHNVSPRRLWFGLVGATCCWIALGITDILITWRECLHQEQYGGASAHPGLLTLNVVLFFVLLAIAVVAGIMSYRSWRLLAGQVKLSHAEATGRQEYMALLGVWIAATIGVGIIWLGIPLMILSLCVRIR